MIWTPTVITEDFEVDGCILFSSFVLGNADIISLIILIHVPDGQLRTVVTEAVFLVFLILYLFPIPTRGGKAKYCDFFFSEVKMDFLGEILRKDSETESEIENVFKRSSELCFIFLPQRKTYLCVVHLHKMKKELMGIMAQEAESHVLHPHIL